jgi:DNA-directed RNA polymerase specialized sigma24 family protein
MQEAVERYGLEPHEWEQACEHVRRHTSEPRRIDDYVLACAYRRGHAEAHAVMRQRYQAVVRGVLRQHSGSHDADLEAEAWTAVWEKIGSYEGRAQLRTWMNVVLKRWCWERNRRLEAIQRRREELRDEHDTPAAEPSVICEQFATAVDAATVDALAALEGTQRALLRLRLVLQMPLDEVRQRPEIYLEREAIQPVYGITRRVQRAARRLRDLVLEQLAARGWDETDFVELMSRCEAVDKLFLSRLQNTPTAPSKVSEE